MKKVMMINRPFETLSVQSEENAVYFTHFLQVTSQHVMQHNRLTFTMLKQ